MTIRIPRERLVEVARLLRDHEEARYDLPLCVTAVDWPDREPEAPRFDIVYQLRSMQHNDVVRLVVQVPEDDPRVPTLEGVFAGMDWHEREAYDLLGHRASRGTTTCAASSCPTTGPATRCARTTSPSASRWPSPTTWTGPCPRRSARAT